MVAYLVIIATFIRAATRLAGTMIATMHLEQGGTAMITNGSIKILILTVAHKKWKIVVANPLFTTLIRAYGVATVDQARMGRPQICVGMLNMR